MIKPAGSQNARALEAARLRVLEHVAGTGPIRYQEIPHRWPVNGYHTRRVIHDLHRDGLLSIERAGGDALVALTAAGREAVTVAPHDS